MRHRNAGFGQQDFELFAAVLDGVHFVVQKVDLPAALEFAQHGFADHAIALAAHKSLDGQTPLRCRSDYAEVAQAFQSHAQGARNRRGGEREHIDLGAKGLHGLFVTHAKAMFLVNDEQTQALELHVLAE